MAPAPEIPDGAFHGASRPPRRVLGSVAAQLVGRLIHLTANVVSTLAIIHYLSPSRYGDYVVALTTVMLAGLIADGGLAKLAIREVAQGTTEESAATGSVAVLRLVLSVAALAISQAALLAMSVSRSVHVAAALLSVTYATESVLALASVVFHVRQRQALDIGVRLFGELVETASLLVMIAVRAPFVTLFLAPVIGGTMAAVLAAIIGRRSFGLGFSFDLQVIRSFFRSAIPLIPALLIGVLSLRLDFLLLAVLRSSGEVGLYGSAFQPIEYAFLATSVVIGTAFPPLAASWALDSNRSTTINDSTVSVLLSVTLMVPVVVAVTAGGAVRAVFGADYGGAAPVLRILAVCLPLMTVNAWNSFVLLAGGQQRATLRYNVLALAAAALIHPFLIHLWGSSGAAVGTFSVMVLVLWSSTKAIARTMDLRVSVRAWVLPLASAAIALAVGGLLVRGGLPWTAVAALTVGVHVAVNFVSHALPLALWASLLGALPTNPLVPVPTALP